MSIPSLLPTGAAPAISSASASETGSADDFHALMRDQLERQDDRTADRRATDARERELAARTRAERAADRANDRTHAERLDRAAAQGTRRSWRDSTDATADHRAEPTDQAGHARPASPTVNGDRPAARTSVDRRSKHTDRDAQATPEAHADAGLTGVAAAQGMAAAGQGSTSSATTKGDEVAPAGSTAVGSGITTGSATAGAAGHMSAPGSAAASGTPGAGVNDTSAGTAAVASASAGAGAPGAASAAGSTTATGQAAAGAPGSTGAAGATTATGQPAAGQPGAGAAGETAQAPNGADPNGKAAGQQGKARKTTARGANPGAGTGDAAQTAAAAAGGRAGVSVASANGASTDSGGDAKRDSRGGELVANGVAQAVHTQGGSAAAPTPAASATQPSGPSNAVLDQVLPVVPRLVLRGDGTQRLTLKLHPADLGEVHLTVTVKDGAVDVTMAAGREARDALRDGSAQLRSLLQLAGHTTGQVVIRDLPVSAPSASTHQPGLNPEQGQSGQQGQAAQQGFSGGDGSPMFTGSGGGHARQQQSPGHSVPRAAAGAAVRESGTPRAGSARPGTSSLDVRI